MKYVKFIAVAALVAFASCGSKSGNSNGGADKEKDSLQENVASKDSGTEGEEVAKSAVSKMPSFDQVFTFIGDAWKKKLPADFPFLKEFGMTCLKYEFEQTDDVGDCYDIFYGKNAEVKQSWSDEFNDYVYDIAPTGKHAIIIHLALGNSGNNEQYIFFGDKADYDRFLNQITDPNYPFEGKGLNEESGMYMVLGTMECE